jgi:hypothetical protein
MQLGLKCIDDLWLLAFGIQSEANSHIYVTRASFSSCSTALRFGLRTASC